MRKIISDKYGAINLLSGETLKILLAVIGLGLLIFLVVSIWYSLSGDSKYNQAEASLNNVIYSEIQRINSGVVENPLGIIVPNPSGWDIIGFTENIKPNSCVGENCICICDVFFFDTEKSQAKKCDDKGICQVVENLVSFNRIKIASAGTSLAIKLTARGIEIK